MSHGYWQHHSARKRADFRRVFRHEIVAGNAETGIRLIWKWLIATGASLGYGAPWQDNNWQQVYRNERGRQTEREGSERCLFTPRHLRRGVLRGLSRVP